MPYGHLANLTELELDAINGVIRELGEAMEAAETAIDELPATITPATVSVLKKLATDGTAAGNTASETTSFTYTVPGGTLGTAGKVRLFFRVQVRNHSAAGQYCTIRVKYGGTTVLSWVYSGGDGAYGILTIAAYIMGDGDAAVQIAAGMRIQYSTGTFTSLTETGSASISSLSDQALAVTLQWDGTGGADQNAFVDWANVVAET